MALRRGPWKVESVNKTAAVKSSRYGARPATIQKEGASNSEHYLASRAQVIDEKIPTEVSEFRRAELLRATTQSPGDSSNPTPLVVYSNSFKKSQEIKEHYLKKQAASVTSGGFSTAGGGTVIQAPEIYSPLFQMANLQLPRERITMNAWNRNFYETHPLVHNCINLHATYPINKINIKCKDGKIEQFFKEMAESIDLVGVLQAMALEIYKVGECLVPGSKIVLGDGSVKSIEDIIVGDTVLTHTGAKKRVVELKTRNVDEEICEIEFYGSNQKVQITGNHPVFSIKQKEILCCVPSRAKLKQKCWPTESCQLSGHYTTDKKSRAGKCKTGQKNWNYNWIRASELAAGDIVLLPINTTINNDFSKSISKEWAKLLGYFASEGCYHKNNKGEINGIIIATGDEEINSDVESLCKVLSLPYRLKTVKAVFEGRDLGYNMVHIIITDKQLALDFYEHCGEYSHSKRLSNKFMESDITLQKEFLEAYISGDGSIDKTIGRVEIATGSECMAYQLRQILGRLGITSSVTKTSRFKTAGSFKKYKVTRPVFFIKSSFGSVDKKITGLVSYKQKILNEFSSKRKARIMFSDSNNNGISTQIKSITRTHYCGRVFNLEVSDDHSYVVNGMAVHNCFPYAELDEHRGVWKSIVIQNPDYVHIKTSVLGGEPIISLQPDAALKRMIQSNNPADIQLRSQIDEEILYHIRKGNNIPLNNFNVSHLALKSAPYDVHGTSPIVTVYKDLMLYDRLRESKFAQADSLINPITLVKIGGNADGEYRASGDDLEKWRQTMEAASYDKDFKIICHGGVEITRVGANGAIIDINPDIQAILDNILYGLMVPKAVVTQEGASFNSATVGLEVLKQRYESFRNMMAQWLIKKIFAPISEIQEFYEYKDGDKKLIVPEIEWNRMILFDMDNYINVLNGLVKEKAISKTTLFRSLGLNLDEENRLRKEELIQDAIYEKEKAILAGMTLGMLRSVNADDDIIEPTESNALPGTPGSEDAGVPGMAPPGGGGLGGGGPLGGGLGGGAGPLGGPSGGGLGDIPTEGLGEPGSGSAAEPMGLETPPAPAPPAPTK